MLAVWVCTVYTPQMLIFPKYNIYHVTKLIWQSFCYKAKMTIVKKKWNIGGARRKELELSLQNSEATIQYVHLMSNLSS